MKKLSQMLIVVLMALLAGTAFADSIHYEAADGSAALRFQNLGTETVTISIYDGGASATNLVTIGSTENTIDGSGGTDTVAELAVAIAAATNSAGVPVLLMDTACALAADSTDGELLDGTYTAAAAVGAKYSWGEILWDTSDVKFYSVYIPAARQDPNGVRASIDIAEVYGNPLGTGDGTISIYIDGTLAWQMQNPELFLATNAVATPVGIPAKTDSVLVRVARATAATTGMVGVKVTPTDQK